MRVHHLNCAAIVLPQAPESMPPIPCHVLVCEAASGLVLIDSGFGVSGYLQDDRLGVEQNIVGPPEDVALTALRQIEAMGYTSEDVTDIVLTHLDGDHIGGLSDFPHARVHATAAEHDAAISNPNLHDRPRYNPQDWAHDPKFVLYAGPGDEWRFGLTAHEVLPGITLIPLPGHSRGHAAVAVEADGQGLIFHAGDATFDANSHGALDAGGQPLPELEFLREVEKMTGHDLEAVSANHIILSRLSREPGVTVINSHDYRLLTKPAAESA